jgi:hypothetical protein
MIETIEALREGVAIATNRLAQLFDAPTNKSEDEGEKKRLQNGASKQEAMASLLEEFISSEKEEKMSTVQIDFLEDNKDISSEKMSTVQIDYLEDDKDTMLVKCMVFFSKERLKKLIGLIPKDALSIPSELYDKYSMGPEKIGGLMHFRDRVQLLMELLENLNTKT